MNQASNDELNTVYVTHISTNHWQILTDGWWFVEITCSSIMVHLTWYLPSVYVPHRSCEGLPVAPITYFCCVFIMYVKYACKRCQMVMFKHSTLFISSALWCVINESDAKSILSQWCFVHSTVYTCVQYIVHVQCFGWLPSRMHLIRSYIFASQSHSAYMRPLVRWCPLTSSSKN